MQKKRSWSRGENVVRQDRSVGGGVPLAGRETLSFYQTGVTVVVTPLLGSPSCKVLLRPSATLVTSPLCTHSVLPSF